MSTTKTVPASGQPGPVGKLYLKDAEMKRLMKDVELPFKLVDVPVNTVKCRYLIGPVKFENESDVQKELKGVLNILFIIATNSILADCKFELVSKEVIFGGFGGRADIFAYLLFGTKAIPCLICEVKFPGRKGVDNKVIMQALKYLVSVHSQTGCDVVFGLISTYETTHVIWIKKVGVDLRLRCCHGQDETCGCIEWVWFKQFPSSSTSSVYQG